MSNSVMYVIVAHSGDYENHTATPICGGLDKEAVERELVRLTDLCERTKTFQKELLETRSRWAALPGNERPLVWPADTPQLETQRGKGPSKADVAKLERELKAWNARSLELQSTYPERWMAYCHRFYLEYERIAKEHGLPVLPQTDSNVVSIINGLVGEQVDEYEIEEIPFIQS